MKTTIKILATAIVIISVVSCQDDAKPNYQFMPNMYESVGYETYGEYGVFGETGQEAMLPAEGSIPRGWMPYELENSAEGYQMAKDSLKNSIKYTKENEEAGKALYDIYCAICHGTKGDGKGTLVQREKILGVPSYDDIGRAITEGSIYHVMYYGINSMGSYAAQTSEHERWQIVQYVEKLKADLEGKTPRIDADLAVVETKVEEEHQESTEQHDNAH
ncbi:cytochrome c [Aquimarina sp. MMG016]|uniref:c-type cytochrome n=1 Tax=Aquimarina sp. MMG016 TaxID=2822690 RepID=UPI001B3A6F78|nr:cytochrome c [Aquimarina sp. MMG016]MBQ4818705.1 cytochrome c [Aquimarina sp. MMG016]